MAWFILVSSFLLCVLGTVAVPWGGRAVARQATQPLTLFVQTNRGTLVLNDGGSLSVDEVKQKLEAPLRVETNSLADSGIVEVWEADESRLLARMQVGGNSDFVVERATAPRFGVSDLAPRVRLELRQGSVRLSLPRAGVEDSDVEGGVSVEVVTDDGSVRIEEPGYYRVEKRGGVTEVSVLSGAAEIIPLNNESTLRLNSGQRASMTAGDSPIGPESAERNLIVNGTFNDGLADWTNFVWTYEEGVENNGETLEINDRGESAVRFRRQGVGHADTRIRQTVNRNVLAFSVLEVSVSLRIWNQSLPVCGFQATECPLIIKINYEDELGRAVAWQQGIYATEPNAGEENNFPLDCTQCGIPLGINKHWRTSQFGEVLVYESVNLAEQLSQEGFRPAFINNIEIISQGHAFEVDVIEISLLARD